MLKSDMLLLSMVRSVLDRPYLLVAWACTVACTYFVQPVFKIIRSLLVQKVLTVLKCSNQQLIMKSLKMPYLRFKNKTGNLSEDECAMRYNFSCEIFS